MVLLASVSQSDSGGSVSCNQTNATLASTVIIDSYTSNETWNITVPLNLGTNLIECRFSKGNNVYSTNITVNRITDSTTTDLWYNVNNLNKSVNFEVRNLNPAKTVSNYQASFGDTSNGTYLTAEFSHFYSTYGSYNISLTVNYTDSTSETITKTIEVIAPENVTPKADFDFLTDGKTISDALFFGIFSWDRQTENLNYSWNFGDGTFSTQKNPLKAYTSLGNFTVTLTVTDEDNNSSSFSKTISIVEESPVYPPHGSFNWYLNGNTAPTSGWFGAFDSYDPNGGGSIVSYEWDFGNGTTATGINPTGYFPIAGNYNVTLKVTDNDGYSSSVSQTVWVYPAQNQSPSVTSAVCTRYPRGSTFDFSCVGDGYDNEGPITTWEWTWDDGTTSYGQTVQKLYSQTGSYYVRLRVYDSNGAYGSNYQVLTVYSDGSAPLINIPNQNQILSPSNDPLFDLPITVSDESSVNLKVFVNSIQQYSTQLSPTFSTIDAPLELSEGLNLISVKTTDVAGNTATYSYEKIIDSISPELASLTPANNTQVVNTGFVTIAGSANEQLSHVYINNQELPLASDFKTFSYNLPLSYNGLYSYEIKLVDLVGNETLYSRNLNITNKVINQNLVTISPLGEEDKLLLVGAAGAARAGTEVTGRASFFNSDSTIANPDGSFQIILDYFDEVTVSAFDDIINQEEEFELTFLATTTLSGIIKDKNALPLPGVKVTISSSAQTATTDSSGTFQIVGPASGDQHIILDPSTIPANITGTDRKFFTTTISYNIGRTQLNVMPPIYLNSLIIDGTQTQITPTAQVVVTSPHATGFELIVPAGEANFPTGLSTGEISVEEVSSSFLTIPAPEFAKPDTVYALEPSGLTFDNPVQVSLPNPNNFPPGLNVLIMSKNSNTGSWEIDGVAEVSENGESITTKTGMGITHFSEIYAAPVMPTLKTIGKDDQPQVGLQDSSLTTTIQLPEFKSMNSWKTPGLIYNSAWANPSILVKHAVSYDNKKVTKNSQNVYNIQSTKIVENLETLSWPELEYAEFSFESEGISSEKRRFTGIPNNSLVSYSMDASSLGSGIHSYIAHFGLKFAQMTVSTQSLRFETRYKKNIFGGWGTKRSYQTNYYSYKSVLEELIPQDHMGAMFVSNKIDSNYGRGWKISGFQELLTTKGPKIALEDGGGNINTFSIDQQLLTVHQDSEGVSSASLNSYPLITYISDNGKIKTKDVNNSSATVQISTVPTYTASFTTGAYETIINGQITGCFRISANMSVKPAGGNILKSSQGFILSPDAMNGILSITANSSSYLSGGTSKTPTSTDMFSFQDIYPYPENASIARSNINSACNIYNSSSSGSLPVTGNGNGSTSVARFNAPFDILETSQGIFLVTDKGNNVIRKLDLNTNTVSAYAGTGFRADNGNGGLATLANFDHPRGLAKDNLGNIFVSSENGLIRKIDVNGYIHHVAGKTIASGGSPDYSTSIDKINLADPTGIAFDDESNSLFVADTGHNRIVRLDFDNNLAETVAGTGQCAATDSNSVLALEAKLCSPTFVHLDADKNLIILDKGNKRIRKLIISSSTSTKVAYKSSTNNGDTLYKNLDGSWELNYRNGTVALFNIDGKITKLQGRDGNFVSYNYSGSLLSSIVDPVGSTLSLSYNSSNILQSITDPAGRVTQFTHGSNSRLDEVEFPDGSTKTFVYDSNGRLIQENDQAGFETKYTFNDWGRLKKVIYPNGLTREYDNSEDTTIIGKDIENSPIITTDFSENGDDNNDLNLQINEGGKISKIIPGENGKVAKLITPNGDEYNYEYDTAGRLTKTILPDLTYFTTSYGNFNDIVDTFNSSTGFHVIRTFNAFGQLLTESTNTGSYVENTYSNTGYLNTTKNSLNEISQFTYNSKGQVLTATNNLNILSSNAYDTKGNISSSTNGVNKTTSYTRDSAGNVLTKTDPENKITTYYYDLHNRLIEIKTPDNKSTAIDYESRGLISQVVDPLQNTTTYTYNEIGKQLTKTTPDLKVYEMTYDLNGNMTSSRDPRNLTTTYTYDLENRLFLKQTPDDTYEYSYDTNGNLLEAKNSVSKVNFEYTKVKGDDVVASKVFTGLGILSGFPSYTHEYDYDLRKNRIALGTSRGTTSFSYNTENRLISMQAANGTDYTYGRDGIGRLVSISGDGYTKTQTLNNVDFTNAIAYTVNSNTIASFNYTRNNSNLVTAKVDSSGSTAYGYNSNDQLTSATTSSYSETYAYDELGNRSSDIGGTYGYDAKKQYLQEDYRNYYSYDLAGNLTSKQEKGMTGNVTNHSYNSLNQLVTTEIFENSVKVKTIHNKYDVFGKRMQKTVEDHALNITYSQKYEYDGQEIISVFNSSNTVLATFTPSYLESDDMLAMDVTSSGASAGFAPQAGHYFYVKDNLGSIIEIRNSSGSLIQKNSYSSYGDITKVADSSGTDITSTPIVAHTFSFTGREYDKESKLFYYRARFYDQQSGRFLSKDPASGSISSPITFINSYTYGGSDPANNVDPSGRSFWSKVAAIGLGSLFAGPAGVLLAINFSGEFSSGEIQFANTAAIIYAAAVTGGAAGGLVGGGFVGALAGGAAGGIVGGIGYDVMGYGTFQDGFIAGAIAGAIAGYQANSVTNNSVANGTKVANRSPVFWVACGLAAAAGFAALQIYLQGKITNDAFEKIWESPAESTNESGGSSQATPPATESESTNSCMAA